LSQNLDYPIIPTTLIAIGIQMTNLVTRRPDIIDVVSVNLNPLIINKVDTTKQSNHV